MSTDETKKREAEKKRPGEHGEEGKKLILNIEVIRMLREDKRCTSSIKSRWGPLINCHLQRSFYHR